MVFSCMVFSRRRITARVGLRLASLLAAATVLVFASGATARADSGTATAVVGAGTLSETTGTLAPIGATLDGTDKTLPYVLPITVVDATGSGNGWNLTITSTQFTTGGGSPHTLAVGASRVQQVSAACGSQSTCSLPTNAITYPLTIPAAAAAPTSVKLFNAAAGSGMGAIVATALVNVTIPASAYAGSYNSTLTVGVVTGP